MEEDEFDDQMKQLALRYSQTAGANGDAARKIAAKRSDFLVAFERALREDIRPVLLSAKAGLQTAPPEGPTVNVEVREPVGENSIALTVSRGGKSHTLRFYADPIEMKVMVAADGVIISTPEPGQIDKRTIRVLVSQTVTTWILAP